MRVELPGGGWVEVRDKLMAQDKIAALSAVKIIRTSDPADDKREIREEDGGTLERARMAMLAQTITAWSFPGVPIPAQNIADPAETIGSILDLDDYEALSAAVEPMLSRLLRGPKPPAQDQAPDAETATP